MKKYPIELLAPAKNLEAAMAAIDYGADAIYMGAERFGAKTAAAYGYKKGIKQRYKTDKYTKQYQRKGKQFLYRVFSFVLFFLEKSEKFSATQTFHYEIFAYFNGLKS